MVIAELVERRVGQRHAPRREVGQDRGDRKLGQPTHRGDLVLGGGDILA
jgi:hypothetical protein